MMDKLELQDLRIRAYRVRSTFTSRARKTTVGGARRPKGARLRRMRGESPRLLLWAWPISKNHRTESVRPVAAPGQYLWPRIFSAFVASDGIPLAWRRLLAISVYTYARPEEIEPLEWSDVNLELGVISIHRAVDRVRDKGKIKTTKTGKTRRVPIERELLPLLSAMHKEQGGKGRVVLQMPKPHELARQMRAFLGKALAASKIDPADLFTADATRRKIDWYGATRGTGITWCAVRGDDPLKIMQRAGHAEFKTTMGYIREAENLSAGLGFGRPFPPLPQNLLGAIGFQSVNRTRKMPQTPGNPWAQQDLNL